MNDWIATIIGGLLGGAFALLIVWTGVWIFERLHK